MKVLRRLALPILLFVALLALIALAGVQRTLDDALFRALTASGSASLTLADEVRLIDLPYPESLRNRDDPTIFRARLAELLGRIAADTSNLPRAVVLDIWFSKDDRGLAPLADAIAALDKARVPTYASFNPDAGGHPSIVRSYRVLARFMRDGGDDAQARVYETKANEMARRLGEGQRGG